MEKLKTERNEQYFFNEVKDIFLDIFEKYAEFCMKYEKNRILKKDAILILINDCREYFDHFDGGFEGLWWQLMDERKNHEE